MRRKIKHTNVLDYLKHYGQSNGETCPEHNSPGVLEDRITCIQITKKHGLLNSKTGVV